MLISYSQDASIFPHVRKMCRVLFDVSVTTVHLKKPSQETLKLSANVRHYDIQSIAIECLHIV